MAKIKKIKARQVLDSRGSPTIEVDVVTNTGEIGSAIVPSGASTGSKEAIELRDNDMTYYNGKSVLNAVQNVNGIINNELQNKDIFNQIEIDNILIQLDGTKNKSHLGANAILGVSMAVAKAAAMDLKKPLFQYLSTETPHVLPVPMMNILNGGQHANNNIDIQEFMIMPWGAPSFSDALRMGVEIFYALKTILNKNGLNTAVGDEGGFAPSLKTNEDAIEIILIAIQEAGYTAGKDVSLALDVAASELFEENQYHFKGEGKKRSTKEMIEYLIMLTEKYPIVSIEDGLDEYDWKGWHELTNRIGHKVQLVGDDLFVTNPEILKKGIDEKVANAILIKLNQIGTISETREAIKLAKEANYSTVISHRSGESEDTFIADFSVATNAGQIKTGSLCRSDRTAKYNQLLRIEEQLGKKGTFLQKEILSSLSINR